MFVLLFVLLLSRSDESRTGDICVGPLWLMFYTDMFSHYLILGAEFVALIWAIVLDKRGVLRIH